MGSGSALYRGLLVGLAAITANSVYLAGRKELSSFYMAMLLLHLTLGAALGVALVVFVAAHLRAVWAQPNRRAKQAGAGLVGAAAACIGAGVALAALGATRDRGLLYWIHVLAAPAGLVLFVLHRRAHTRRMAFRRLGAWASAAGLCLLLLLGARSLERPARQAIRGFAPSSAGLRGAERLDPVALSDVAYCAGCHPTSHARWERSAHRFSSFNNPFYRRSVERLLERTGGDVSKVRWCAGCHDPVVLFSGKMDGPTLRLDEPEGQQGLTCVACHAIAEIKDTTGNAAYTIEEAQQYPFAGSDNRLLREVNKLLIRMDPSLHRQAFLKPLHRTPEFCSTCHKVALIPELNGYRWLRGQNHYDTWYDSGVSGHSPRSFYSPPATKACRDCHLPAIPSREFGHRSGQVHDHLFPAANTALPAARGDDETVATIQRFLEGSLSVDLFALRRGGEVVAIDEATPPLRPGEEVELHVVVRNLAVGHPFTNGTADSNETWVALRAAAGGRVLLDSGVLDDRGQLDQAAESLSARLLDHQGAPVTERQPQEIHTVFYNNNVGPGSARVVRYRVKLPADAAGPLVLDASLNYRKFTRDYALFTFGPGAPSLPVTTIARHHAELPVGSGRPAVGKAAPPWRRWNDHGIGLLSQGDVRGAVGSFRRVAALAPELPDGPLNEARALLQEGAHDEAARALDEAERRGPGSPKVAFFRATLASREGRLDQALVDLDRVLAAYPRDRGSHNLRGRVLYLASRHEEAIASFQQTLAIDAEDLTARYGRLLSLRALGRHDEADREQSWYEAHKDDEAARSLTQAYRLAHPIENRESQPIHVHDDVAPVFPPR